MLTTGLLALALSQGEQDWRLRRLLHGVLGLVNGTFVEFGFPSLAMANTEALRLSGWTGIRFDGRTNNSEWNCHQAWISSVDIVPLFRKHRVALDVDYVSIDIDSADIWVFEAIARSEFRPKVFTIEYNSNYPVGVAITFPDPSVPSHVLDNYSETHMKWDRGCFYGASMSAIDLAARKHGYVVVDVEPGFDLFLVRADLWGRRPVPSLHDAPHATQPRNINGRHAPMPHILYRTLLDFGAYQQNGSADVAREAAQLEIRRLRDERNPCFAEQRSYCDTENRTGCTLLNSQICPRVCDEYSSRLPLNYTPPEPLFDRAVRREGQRESQRGNHHLQRWHHLASAEGPPREPHGGVPLGVRTK
jgi:hypothetical protein